MMGVLLLVPSCTKQTAGLKHDGNNDGSIFLAN